MRLISAARVRLVRLRIEDRPVLFSSPEFLFGFLPATFIGFWLVALTGRTGLMQAWLVAASAYFYARWNFDNAIVLATVGTVTFALVRAIRPNPRGATIAAIGIAFNLAVLGWFKYSGFIAANIQTLVGATILFVPPALPLAISFFTFQKIALLADAKRGLVNPKVSPTTFALFVIFFPQLIAGPIVHFRQIAPQFSPDRWLRIAKSSHIVGLIFISIGLAKKVVIADNVATHVVNPYFSFVDSGGTLDVWRAWLAALGYSVQIYYDFSGYSDIAIGLALLFGIGLPVNFLSPYQATSIIDFWRRWHITLSRFLTEYLYIPLGGNRKGTPRRFLNLLLVMLLGGLWHGAEWTFVAWGALHGVYLSANHAWRFFFPPSPDRTRAFTGWALTFFAVVVAWVFFRATSFGAAFSVLQDMAGRYGVLDVSTMVSQADRMMIGGPEVMVIDQAMASLFIVAALVVAFTAPNTIQLTNYAEPTETKPVPSFHVSGRLAAWSGVCAGAAVWQILSGQPSEFIYFRF